jgi:hypothetical protein
MDTHRDKVLVLFEKHRFAPGAPYDDGYFLDFLLPNPKKKGALYDSFRGLRRFNAFFDEVQYEFAICFSVEDRDANYSLDRFVDRVKELEKSRRSSLASLKNRMRAGVGVNVIFFANFPLVIMAIFARNNMWAMAVLAVIAAIMNVWFARFSARARAYHARLLSKIQSTDQRA